MAKPTSLRWWITNTRSRDSGCSIPKKPSETLRWGETVEIGQKQVLRLPPRLPELTKGMLRERKQSEPKTQVFSSHDSGAARATWCPKLASGAQGYRCTSHVRWAHSAPTSRLNKAGQEHADVGLENLRRAEACWAEFPTHHHIEGTVESSTEAIAELVGTVDAVVLDLPDHPPAILATAALIKPGGRLACYCPVSSQLEHAWDAAERAGLTVEWAGELMEREWGRASKGGMRPVNGPFGHTAFLLVAQNGDHSITRILLSHFGQVNRKGATLLAVRQGGHHRLGS